MNYVYLLRCADGSLYCGWTTDLERRLKAHNSGTGAKYTRSRLPVELAYYEEYEDRTEALSREWHIKRMTREEKLKLIMKYTGKYKEMADQFRKDGADEQMIERFIREEMEADAFAKGKGTTDINAYKEWMSLPERAREMYLNNAFCTCGDNGSYVTSFAPGYTIRKDRYGLIIEGVCVRCGKQIARVCD